MHWVIQGEEIYTQDLKTLAKLSQAKGIQKIYGTAFCLMASQPNQEIPEYCQQRRLDCAYVVEEHYLADFKLAVFDMDSTLICNECIDEMAEIMGIRDVISTITEKAMNGDIPYKESLLSRLKALSGLDEALIEKVAQSKIQIVNGAQKLLSTLHQQKVETAIITGGFFQFARHVAQHLNIKRIICNQLVFTNGKMNGNLTGPFIDSAAKAKALLALCEELKINPKQTIAIGDGANDIDLIQTSGTGIAFHAKPILRNIATHHLDFVGLDGVLAIYPPQN